MAERNPYIDATNASGFPLQIAVENLVMATKLSHGWDVVYVEHSWKNRLDDKSGFIDLVLRDQYGTSTLVVECKRVRDTAWIFLPKNGADNKRRHCKSWVSRYAGGRMKHYGWHDLSVSPATPEALYCIVPKDSGATPMLERIASELVSATEALAAEERDYRPGYEHMRCYFNVIVTTAEIKVCKFSPDSISIKDGLLESADFVTVPYVRFRKQLAVKGELFSMEDYKGGQNPSIQKEQTIFVVNSNALSDFLLNFDVGNNTIFN